MRLIDADALIKDNGLESATKYGNRSEKQRTTSYSTMMLYEIAEMIDEAPTIDAEPVKHAKNKLIDELNTELSGYRQNAIVFKPELMYTLKECEPKLEEWHNENPTYQNLQEIRYRAAKAEYDKIMKVLNGWGIKTTWNGGAENA